MSGTGIAGAQDHQPATDAMICFICQKEMEMPFSARNVPGSGFGMVCSKACAEDPRFAYQPPVFAHFHAMGALCDAMGAYLEARELSGPLPDHAPVLRHAAADGSGEWIITAGMIRAAGGML